MRTAEYNPFAAVRFNAVSFFSSTESFAQILDDFESLGKRACIVGPHGCGKTTLAKEMMRHYQSAGVSVLKIKPREEDRKRAFMRPLKKAWKHPNFLVFDGWESLRPPERREAIRLSERSYGSIAITHGHAPWPLLRRLAPSQTDLMQVMERVLGQPWPLSRVDVLSSLFDGHSGNAHLILFDLFDLWANGELPEINAVKPC